jgi:protoheme IX farnesyltransferase
MKRTRGRPIPTGRIDASWALFLAVLLILIGMSVLASVKGDQTLVLALGVLALVWYNGLYTYLKRVTAFAVVPGAMIGAIPPLIGYAALGGALVDPDILLLAFFLFVWQIPHFWLLMLMLGDEYREAGLPTVADRFTRPQLLRITSVWIMATAVGGLAFPALSRIGSTLPWALVVVVASAWLVLKATDVIRASVGEQDRALFRQAFRRINAYAVIIMACLSLGALAARGGRWF